MRRDVYVLQRVATLQNVLLAVYKACRAGGAGGAGADRRKFLSQLQPNCEALLRSLAAGDWTPQPFHRFIVWDPKQREIHAAHFADRVAHHALMNVAGPMLERGATESSFACRQGRGSLRAVAAVRHAAARSRWFLKLDIRRYFDSVSHQILTELLHRRFKDQGFLQTLERIINGFQKTLGHGLPIGTLTSQYLANFFLDGFDHWIQQQACSGYARYMDDFVIFHTDQDALADVFQHTESWLGQQRSLRLRESCQPQPVQNGVPFLGYRVFPGAVLLARKSRHRFTRRLKSLELSYDTGNIDALTLQQRTDALLAFTRHADCLRWRQRVVNALGCTENADP